MKKPIYLDNNSTTPCDPEVIREVSLCLEKVIGNPSSIHKFGKKARQVINHSKDLIASYLKVDPKEIIFTSSGTEGINLVLRGFIKQIIRKKPVHIITTDLEHAAVYYTLKDLEEEGLCRVTYLKGNRVGAVSAESVEKAIENDTKLIVVMAANNETGVKSDIASIAQIAKKYGVHFFVDAVQVLGKEPIVIEEGISAMCFSGHKVHAPKGVGFVVIKKPFKIKPCITGGGQEFGLRSGTENVAAIAGLAKAIELLQKNQESYFSKIKFLRDSFEKAVLEKFPYAKVNGEGKRVINVSNICFQGVEGDLLLMQLDQEGVAVSHGSACASGALEPSRVLLNMGIAKEDVLSSIRFSFSRMNTEKQVKKTLELLTKILQK